MAFSNPYQTYQKQAVTTSKPEDLTFMLFEGMVKFIRLSKLALQESKLEECHSYNLRAQDIITELIVTLNKDYPISEQLLPLYEYMKQRLVEANMKKDIAILDEVENFAVELTETWSSAMKSKRTQK